MKPAKPEPIRLGRGHCCMCDGVVCGHIGGPFLCAKHQHEVEIDLVLRLRVW